MRGGNRQYTGRVIGKQIRQSANVAGLIQNTLGNNQQGFARFGHAQQAFTATDKNLNAKFIFKFTNMSADSRLRGVQYIRDFRQVVILTGRLADYFKLLEIHFSLRAHQTLRYC